MSEPSKAKKPDALAQIDAFVRDPVKVRFGLTALLIAGWYGAYFRNFEAKIEEVRGQIAREREMVMLARQVGSLREQEAKYEGQLMEEKDANAWFNAFLKTLHTQPVRIKKLRPLGSQSVGPFEAAAAEAVAVGTYPDIRRFLRWLGSGEELRRIEKLDLKPLDEGDKEGAAPGDRQYTLTVHVICIMG